MRKNLILGAAVGAALVLSSGSLALAAGGNGGSHQAQGGASARSAVTAPVVFACDGGAQKQVKNRIVSSPFTFAENPGVDIAIPGAAVAIAGPASGTDTLVVTFSAETQLTGSTTNQDWMGLEVQVDGVPIRPFTAVGDVMALSGSPTWNEHSATFCTKIRPGNHSVRAFTNLVDNDTNDTLGGWIDDYTLSVEKSD
jgi:hypothetical protein